MGIKALKGNEITFSCVTCEREGQARDMVIDVADVKVYKGSEDFLYALLPPCAECGALMYMFAGALNKGVKAHMRRIVIRRAAENGQLVEGTSQGIVDKCLSLFKGFYNGRATATMKAEYNEEVSIDLSA